MTHIVRKEPITLEEYAAKLEEWRGVRYVDSGMSKGGIDCLRFVIVIADWLHGWDTSRLPPIPKKPKQTALHDPRTSFRIVKFVRARYPSEVVWHRKMLKEALDLKPGDCLLVRNQVHPGHGLIAGPEKNTCWHSINHPSLPHGGNVHETSLGWCFQTGLLEVFRGSEMLLQC
jgi:hypothetical protein